MYAGNTSTGIFHRDNPQIRLYETRFLTSISLYTKSGQYSLSCRRKKNKTDAQQKQKQNCSRWSKLPCLQPYCVVDIVASQKILSLHMFASQKNNFLGIEVGLKLFFICSLEMVEGPL